MARRPAPEPASAGPSRPLGEQGERTRARLLAAAEQVFRERGFSGTRVDDITDKAGTSHGAFYLYFSNKNDILEALAVETAREMYALAEAMDAIGPGEDGYEQLRAWVERFVDTYDRHAPVIIGWSEADAEDGRFDALGREVLGKFAGRIAQTISQAVADGTRHPVDPATAAVALVAMLERFCYFWLVRGGEFDRAVVVDTLASVWYEAIFGQRVDGVSGP